MEERIKELEDMLYMINNYQILGATMNYYFKPNHNWTMEKHVFYKILLKRTEYSKIIVITYNYDELKKESYDEYGIISMGIDKFAVIGVKQCITDEIKEANKNLWRVEE